MQYIFVSKFNNVIKYYVKKSWDDKELFPYKVNKPLGITHKAAKLQ